MLTPCPTPPTRPPRARAPPPIADTHDHLFSAGGSSGGTRKDGVWFITAAGEKGWVRGGGQDRIGSSVVTEEVRSLLIAETLYQSYTDWRVALGLQ